jgi:hypothetical protein
MSDLVYQRDSKKPIYVSTYVYRALWLLAKSNEEQDTPDKVADAILRDQIAECYPAILEHQKQIAKLEAELLKTL